MHMCMCAFTRMCVDACTCVHTCVRGRVCVLCVCACVCLCICGCVLMRALRLPRAQHHDGALGQCLQGQRLIGGNGVLLKEGQASRGGGG